MAVAIVSASEARQDGAVELFDGVDESPPMLAGQLQSLWSILRV